MDNSNFACVKSLSYQHELKVIKITIINIYINL